MCGIAGQALPLVAGGGTLLAREETAADQLRVGLVEAEALAVLGIAVAREGKFILAEIRKGGFELRIARERRQHYC